MFFIISVLLRSRTDVDFEVVFYLGGGFVLSLSGKIPKRVFRMFDTFRNFVEKDIYGPRFGCACCSIVLCVFSHLLMSVQVVHVWLLWFSLEQTHLPQP